MRGWRRMVAAATGLAFAAPAAAQVAVEQIKVHGAALEGNLEGNSADRDVFVVLPPSYAKSPERRYPVVYFLHGFTAHAADYMKMGRIEQGAAAAQASGPEMIVVVPDSYTRHGGSMYSSSVTTGDFEAFVARDLVAYVDGHYRTIPERASRGLAGHSMGGYGTLKIGMKYPQVFSSLYAMSACCISPRTIAADRGKALEAMTPDAASKGDFQTRADFAAAAAWSPAPGKAPLFLDIGTEGGVVQPQVMAEWAANSPLAMVPQYVPALKAMTAISLDVGDKDFLLGDDTAIHDALNRFGVQHGWAVYQGDHVNRVGDRFQAQVVPFFAAHLKAR